MLTFNSLGRKGNLGNQLFHIASTIGIAQKNGHEFVFPKWEYSVYFNYKLPFIVPNLNITFVHLIEKSYSFYDWNLDSGNYDVNGALQSEKYFDAVFTKQLFEFKTDFLKKLLEKHKHLFDNKPIFISVRRGDFVYHSHYYQLPYQYYFLALKENFADWEERNVIFMSDDINYCKFHFGFLKNAIFLENISAIEQLAISSQGQDFIISNSTFSWWVAWLGEKNGSKIVRPLRNFRGSFSKLHDDSDFFPKRWIEFDYKKKKVGFDNFGLQFKGIVFQIFEIFQFIVKKAFEVIKKNR